MRAEEHQVVVEEDGVVEIDHLPVKTGDRVKVIVLMPEASNGRDQLYPLRGVGPYQFDDPTALVAPEDWESE